MIEEAIQAIREKDPDYVAQAQRQQSELILHHVATAIVQACSRVLQLRERKSERGELRELWVESHTEAKEGDPAWPLEFKIRISYEGVTIYRTRNGRDEHIEPVDLKWKTGEGFREDSVTQVVGALLKMRRL